MRLTLHTDYAFRILIYLATNHERLSTIDEIAKTHHISKNHLMKVANTLAKAGIIEASRGKGGGLRLAANSLQMKLGAIVRITEPDFALVGCFSSSYSCAITATCQFKHILNNALNSFLKELDSYSLNDLLSGVKLAN